MVILEKEHLHHAYLLPGETSILPNLLTGLEEIGFVSVANPDFFIKKVETFTIDDAREIKSFQGERAVHENKKIIVIACEYLSHQSQHALLKVFEEPAPGVHFFLITPIISILLPTLKSRLFILDQTVEAIDDTVKERVDKFLKGEKEERLTLILKIIKEFEKEETSTPLKVYAASFLNELEVQVSGMENKERFDLETVWKVKDYIHDQGSSVKNLLETLALVF